MKKEYSVKCDDKKINGLALGICQGQAGAGEEFAEEIMPLLKDFSYRVKVKMEQEDKQQEMLAKAWEIALKYETDYLGQNIMPIIYQSCRNHLYNMVDKEHGREKRGAKTITKSMSDMVGGEGSNKEKEIGDLVADQYISPEDFVVGQVAGNELQKLLHEFVETNKNRKHAYIIQMKLEKKSNLEIARDLNDLYEKNPLPFNEVIYDDNKRKTVSRAIKDLKDFLEDKQYSLAGMLETNKPKWFKKKKASVK